MRLMQRHEQQSGDVSVCVRRGDMVWARVQFPHQWWPAVVLSSDNLGLLLSFFHQNDVASPSPTYLVESEVVPFECNFRYLIGMAPHSNKCDDTFYAMVGSALRLLGQRVVSSLRCGCQMGVMKRRKGKGGERTVFDHGLGYSCFEPIGVLGFLRNVAVLPWVDEPDLVDAVRVVAQVHAFRGYCSVMQKKVYRKTTKKGDNVKLHPCSSFSQKVHTVVTQESLAVEPQSEYQIISKEGKKNTAIGAIGRLKATVPVMEGNSEQLCKETLLIIPETPTDNTEAEFFKEISFDLHCSSLEPLYLMGGSLKSEKLSILRFQNVSDRGIADICFRNCSTMSKSYLSGPCNSKTHSSNYVNKRRDNVAGLCCRLPDIQTTLYTRKRRRLDKPSLCDSSTRKRILSFSSINEAFASLQITTKSGKDDDYDVSISSPALANFFSSYGMDMDLYKVFLLHSPIKLKIQDSLSFTYTCGNSSINTHCSAACGMPHLNDACCHVFPQIVRAQNIQGNTYVSEFIKPTISHIKMLGPGESIQKDNQACICFCETNMNINDEVQKVDLKKFQNLTLQQTFTCESLSNLVLGFHPDNCEIDASAAKVKGMPGSTSSVYPKKLQISMDGDTTYLKSKNPGVKLSSGDYLMEDRDRHQHVASRSVLNSKVGQQSKTLGPFTSTSLYMKFPKNFNLPSKEELVKKFSVFGTVDYSKTRVFCSAGSAQVAFYEEADAVAAHLYAKKKKVCFGDANVRFWLDPFEHKRIGFKRFALMPPSASKPTGPPLKSCLKRSNSLRKEKRNKRYRVRFTVET